MKVARNRSPPRTVPIANEQNAQTTSENLLDQHDGRSCHGGRIDPHLGSGSRPLAPVLLSTLAWRIPTLTILPSSPPLAQLARAGRALGGGCSKITSMRVKRLIPVDTRRPAK